MGLNWPSGQMRGGDMKPERQQKIQVLLDKFADVVLTNLARRGLPPYSSPLWRPWHLLVWEDASKTMCAFSPMSGGVPELKFLDRSSQIMPPSDLVLIIKNQLGREVSSMVILPKPDAGPDQEHVVETAAFRHVSDIERSARLNKLGDLAGVQHLESYMVEFLNDHPDPDTNVFIMMRFIASDQMTEAHSAIKDTLAQRGFHAVRADDRDYTGELWSNIEVYMTCCRYGIAVFEDIEQRDFNPNVSLELGYMLGKHKRCLILKEQRLPNLPADVVHRLYKPFDMFDIRASITREVARWIDVDLGLNSALPDRHRPEPSSPRRPPSARGP